MCYSAQIETDYRKYTREFGAQLSLEEFVNCQTMLEAELRGCPA